MEHVRILEALDFHDMKISLKAHDVPLTIAAYRLMSQTVDYPLHLGITEAGTVNTGIIKSAVGIGALLAEGIGDTFRISLTGDPVVEVRVANEILKSLGLKEYGPTLVACPTCGRTSIDLPAIAAQVEEKLKDIEEPIEVAVMGCVVNGPGEARRHRRRQRRRTDLPQGRDRPQSARSRPRERIIPGNRPDIGGTQTCEQVTFMHQPLEIRQLRRRLPAISSCTAPA